MKLSVIGTWINSTTYEKAIQKIILWAQEKRSHYVFAANVHMVMEAWDVLEFREIVNSADLVTPDGMPLVWMLRMKGCRNQQRVYGPTLMLHVMEMTAKEDIPVGFYGGQPDVLEKLVERMQERFPGLNVAYAYSPPFRVLTQEEDKQICQAIRNSGLQILFVGLGCPKQERWMAEHHDRISAVMLGVGAAFDFHAGVVSQAPPWIQRLGMEWAYRFLQEPRRLWKRYLIQNPRFVVLALADLLGILKTTQN
jgi:N-acetylglucosaminyldiphosphoundecaprenol N-acetyl-beta-D-mannosaminyltransferase